MFIKFCGPNEFYYILRSYEILHSAQNVITLFYLRLTFEAKCYDCMAFLRVCTFCRAEPNLEHFAFTCNLTCDPKFYSFITFCFIFDAAIILYNI